MYLREISITELSVGYYGRFQAYSKVIFLVRYF